MARGSGIPIDLRVTSPYEIYPELSFQIPVVLLVIVMIVFWLEFKR